MHSFRESCRDNNKFFLELEKLEDLGLRLALVSICENQTAQVQSAARLDPGPGLLVGALLAVESLVWEQAGSADTVLHLPLVSLSKCQQGFA